ncbi:MAG TPA: ribonuclease J [Acidimicrobiales bacterium]|nr:ribonuclease J [Acidimicrobiales bacterium]
MAEPTEAAGRPNRRRRKKPTVQPVRVVFLGGLGEIGRNCACIEVDGRILVLDCGIMFPDADMPGVDLVLPDFSYLRDNAERVDGVVLTHGHEDHTGGLAYLLRDLAVPIYGSALSLGLARNRIDEAGLADRAQYITVSDGERRRIGPCDVEFIPVTHSVPNAFAIAFHTPQGVVLHSGDFKLDLMPVDGRRTDLARIGALATDPGIRLLLADSTNAEEPGFTPSESTVGATMHRVFAAAAGHRVVVACFASHIHRVQQVIDAAVATGRKVATLGRSMGKNVDLAARLGILSMPDGTLVDINDIDRLADGEVCVISTGSQGEPMSALSLMATGDNKRFQLGDGDVVVISAHPIPGNEWSVGRVIDELYRRGARVVHSGAEAVHVSGHARQGELQTLLSVARPDTFVPVHGEYRHMVHHAALARSMGVPGDQVLLCEDGDVVLLDQDGLRRDGEVPAGYLYVDGTIGDIGHGVLRDRKLLSEEGVVMVVATVDLHRKTVPSVPEIATKGWVYAPEAEALLDEASRVVTDALVQAMDDGARDVEVLSRHARKALGRLVTDRTRRRPMIVPVIMAV